MAVIMTSSTFLTKDPPIEKLRSQSDCVGSRISFEAVMVPINESFKSTLDEVRESDLLLHVVDISNPNYEEQI